MTGITRRGRLTLESGWDGPWIKMGDAWLHDTLRYDLRYVKEKSGESETLYVFGEVEITIRQITPPEGDV